MALIYYILLSLSISLCFGANNVCLYSGTTVLQPLKLTNANCPTNTSFCMKTLYKYGNFQYGGPSSLKPQLGEIVMFLSQDAAGILDFVTFLNAKIFTTLTVDVQITGADPVGVQQYDDPAPEDKWIWDPNTNTGKFNWTTQPTYTDGIILGHINFIDNYCLRSGYIPTSVGSITKISIMSGTVAAPKRIVSLNFTSGQTFEFCQYPLTKTTYENVTCPGLSDGSATVEILFGPPSVFTWRNHTGAVIGNTATISNLKAGIYHVNVNNDNCTADRSVIISEPGAIEANITTVPFTCVANGSASAVLYGGDGNYALRWYKGTVLIGESTSVSNLAIGSYSLCVTSGCQQECFLFDIESVGCCGDGVCDSAEENCVSCSKDCAATPCCPAGTYKSGTTCVVCRPGTYSTVVQATSCTSCPSNTYSPGGDQTCSSCSENYHSAAGSGKCVKCPNGQVRAVNATSCSGCTAGTFASPCGTSACTPCPAGSYSTTSSSACLSCPPGTYQTLAGQSICSTCPENTYSIGGSSVCSDCPVGKISVSGSTHLVACV